MPHSDPDLRMRITHEMRQVGSVTGDTIADLKVALKMDDVSNTQFSRALRSLHFQHPEAGVRVSRPNAGHPHSISAYGDTPPFRVRYVHDRSDVTTPRLVDASSVV